MSKCFFIIIILLRSCDFWELEFSFLFYLIWKRSDWVIWYPVFYFFIVWICWPFSTIFCGASFPLAGSFFFYSLPFSKIERDIWRKIESFILIHLVHCLMIVRILHIISWVKRGTRAPHPGQDCQCQASGKCGEHAFVVHEVRSGRSSLKRQGKWK